MMKPNVRRNPYMEPRMKLYQPWSKNKMFFAFFQGKFCWYNLVLIVDNWVNAVTEGQGEAKHSQVFKCHSVELLGARVLVILLVFKLDPRNQTKQLVLEVEWHVLNFCHFPYLDSETHETWHPDDHVGVIVKHVENNNEILEHIEENWSYWKPLNTFPENNVR